MNISIDIKKTQPPETQMTFCEHGRRHPDKPEKYTNQDILRQTGITWVNTKSQAIDRKSDNLLQ